MSRDLLTQARASLPANAKPWQIAQEVARLAEAQRIADGRPCALQQAVEAFPAALEAYDATQRARLGSEWDERLRAEAAALEADDQARAA